MNPTLLLTILLSTGFLSTNAQSPEPDADDDEFLALYAETSKKKWAKDIANFAKLDAANSYPTNSILFCGSSSIRLWETLETDMAPTPVIQRGFGGSKWSDVAVHADELLTPHLANVPAVVFFVANDIKGAPAEDKTPTEVLRLIQLVERHVHALNPDAEMILLPVTPTEARWKAWPTVRLANAKVAGWAAETPNVHFVATSDLFLGEDGKPIPTLFVKDKLHLNAEGYRLWADRLKAVLVKLGVE